jgi:Zn-dependent peptidase ImmA (M78 family)
MSVAHELGHLVMHRGLIAPLGDLEQQANVFAAELLVPLAALKRELPRPVTLSTVAPLKPRWGVSIQALVRRALEAKVITERQYRYLFEQIGVRQWRTREPIDLPLEKPRAFRKACEMLFGIPIDYRRAAQAFNLSPQMVKDIIDAHAEGGPSKPAEGVEQQAHASKRLLRFSR